MSNYTIDGMYPEYTPLTLENLYDPNFRPSVPGLSYPATLIRPEGRGTSRLLVMGEAAGVHENRDRLPFRPYAQSGSILERALREKGIPRHTLTITNAVLWQPHANLLAGTNFEMSARRMCRSANQELLRKSEARAILALGKTAFEELTGISEVKIHNGRGFIYPALPEYGSLPVILTYHPSFIARGSGKGKDEEAGGAKVKKAEGGGMSLFGAFKRDVGLAFEVARGGVPLREPLTSIYNPPASVWEAAFNRALADPSIFIIYDFETAYSLILSGDEEGYTELGSDGFEDSERGEAAEKLSEKRAMDITQVQFTLTDKPLEALIADWGPEAEYWTKQFMSLPNPKLDVNGRFFDRHLLRTIQSPMNGKFYDLQSMWAHLQPDLPRNLQFIASFFTSQYGAWKHLMGVDMEEYGKHDVIRPWMCLQGMRRLMQRMRHPAPEALDLWTAYETLTRDLEEKCLDRYSSRGVPINRDKQFRLGAKLSAISKELISDIQPLIPDELLPVAGGKEGYVGAPPPFAAIQRERLAVLNSQMKSLKTELRGLAKRLKLGKLVFKSGDKFNIPQPEEIPSLFSEDQTPFRDYPRLAAAIAEATRLRDHGPDEDEWISAEGTEEEVTFVRRSLLVKQEDGTYAEERRWAALGDFNPNSSQQVIKWIEWNRKREFQKLTEEYAAKGKEVPKTRIEAIKWKVPTMKDPYTDELRETTGKAAILKLAKKVNDSVIIKGVQAREVRKLMGTYVGTEKAPTLWTPAPGEFFIHPEFSTYTGTWQLSSKRPNALNYPKHNKTWFEEVRSIVDTSHLPADMEDRCVLEGDYKAFHVLTTGFEANAPRYMRMARLDMHSFFAATQLLRLYRADELERDSDANLKRLYKELRKDPRLFNGKTFDQIRDTKAKPTGLGIGFGMQPGTLYRNNEESFEDEDDAKRTWRDYMALWPEIERWQREVVEEADRNGYLLSRHGGIRWFHCVYHKAPLRPGQRVRPGTMARETSHGTWILTPGDDHESAIAYRPANDAFGMIRGAYLRIEERGWGERMHASIPLHDAMIAFPRWDDREEAGRVMKEEMEKPSEILRLPDGSGLWCEAELSISECRGHWGKMQAFNLG